MCLYNRSVEYLEFEISLHGMRIDNGGKKSNVQASVTNSKEGFFKDPDSYKNLSQEEKEQLTAEMMEKMKVFASDPVGVVVKGELDNG